MAPIAGLTALLRGTRDAARNPQVGRAYLVLVSGLLLLTLLLDGAGLYALSHWLDAIPRDTLWKRVAHGASLVLGAIVVLSVSPLASLLLANVAFPVFAEIPFFAGMRAHAPERARILEGARGLPFARVLSINVIRFSAWALGTLGCFLLAFVPLIGPPLGLVLSFLLAVYTLSWELLDPYLSRRGLGLAEQRRYLREHRGALVGFTGPALLLLAVPLVGPLFFGLVQAATARLVVDVLESEMERMS